MLRATRLRAAKNPTHCRVSAHFAGAARLGLGSARGACRTIRTRGHYEQRPSVWMSRRATGAGAVQLFEIPTTTSNDNTDVLGRRVSQEGKPYHLSYRRRWNKNRSSRRAAR